MEPTSKDCKKSLDQLLGQALAERSREDDQVEVTYELGDSFNYEKRQRLQPSVGSSRTPSVKDEGDDDNTEPLGSIELERKVMKNTIILSIAVVLSCNGFYMLQTLQSSIFPIIGVQALCVIYSFSVISCAFAPSIVHKFGITWTNISFSVASCLYLSVFYFYNSYALIICAILVGLTFGPVFCAYMTYMSLNVSRIEYVTQTIREKTQQRFLKYFYVVSKTGLFWGNFIASLVMHFDVANVPLVNPVENSTDATEIVTSVYDLCFQVEYKNSLQEFSKTKGIFGEDEVIIQFNYLHQSSAGILVIIFTVCILLGLVLITVFLEKIEHLLQQDPMERPFIIQSLRQIRLVLVDKHIRLSIPLIIFIGIEQGFIFADFTRSYVSCSLGLESIVFTMMCLGGSNTLGCIAVHVFFEHIQRTIIMAACFVCQSGLLMVLYLWTPLKDDAAVFYVIAGGWGLCNAVWETLIVTHFASTYMDDWQIPFTTYHLLQCFGMSLTFAFSNFLTSEMKVCMMALALAGSIAPYTILEFRLHQRSTVHNRTAML